MMTTLYRQLDEALSTGRDKAAKTRVHPYVSATKAPSAAAGSGEAAVADAVRKLLRCWQPETGIVFYRPKTITTPPVANIRLMPVSEHIVDGPVAGGRAIAILVLALAEGSRPPQQCGDGLRTRYPGDRTEGLGAPHAWELMTGYTQDELLICAIARMLEGLGHVAVGASSPIPGAAALLARARVGRAAAGCRCWGARTTTSSPTAGASCSTARPRGASTPSSSAAARSTARPTSTWWGSATIRARPCAGPAASAPPISISWCRA